MEKYRVEFTEADNVIEANITGNWFCESVMSESYLEAFDLIKEYLLIEFGFEPEEFIFRAKTDEDTEWVYD